MDFTKYDGRFLTAKKAWHFFFSRLTTRYEQRRRALIMWINHLTEFRSSPSFFDGTLTVKYKNKKTYKEISINLNHDENYFSVTDNNDHYGFKLQSR